VPNIPACCVVVLFITENFLKSFLFTTKRFLPQSSNHIPASIFVTFLLRNHQMVLLPPLSGNPHIQAFTQNRQDPLHRKRNLVNPLHRCAYDIASSYELVHAEFMNITRMFSRNGYLSSFWTVAAGSFGTESNGTTQRVSFPPSRFYNLIWI